MKDSKKFCVLLFTAILNKFTSVHVFLKAKSDILDSSSTYDILRGKRGVTEAAYAKFVEAIPSLGGTCNFEKENGQSYVVLNNKGEKQYEELVNSGEARSFKPSTYVRKSKVSKAAASPPSAPASKSKLSAKVARAPKAAARIGRPPGKGKARGALAMPLGVIGGILRILKDEKLTVQLLTISDWIEESGLSLGEVLRAASS